MPAFFYFLFLHLIFLFFIFTLIFYFLFIFETRLTMRLGHRGSPPPRAPPWPLLFGERWPRHLRSTGCWSPQLGAQPAITASSSPGWQRARLGGCVEHQRTRPQNSLRKPAPNLNPLFGWNLPPNLMGTHNPSRNPRPKFQQHRTIGVGPGSVLIQKNVGKGRWPQHVVEEARSHGAMSIGGACLRWWGAEGCKDEGGKLKSRRPTIHVKVKVARQCNAPPRPWVKVEG